MNTEKLKQDGYSTPPNHKDFLAKGLFNGGGTLRDGAIAYIEPGGGPIEKHTHPYNHIFIVVKGEITVMTEDGENKVCENSSIIINGITPHALINSGNTQAEVIGLTTEV